MMKQNYYLHLDESIESKEVEKRLRSLGIALIRVPDRGGVLPKLIGPEGVFQGTASILTYFTNRAAHTSG
jgi:hypothetical protein